MSQVARELLNNTLHILYKQREALHAGKTIRDCMLIEQSEQKSTCLESNRAKTLTARTMRANLCKLGDKSEQSCSQL
jgi:hypothetical protein